MFTFGLVGGCDDSGGGGKDPDASEDEDASDGETVRGKDGGMDGEVVEEDAEPDACVSTVGCEDLGAECGEPLDNCGEPLDCGDDCVDPSDPSTDYFTCGGDPEAGEYKCGCKPKSCDDALVCGSLPDGCGGEISCGDDCENPNHTCEGGGTPYECGCSPNLGACGTAQCGTAADGCGNTVQCGSHGGGCSDARTCNGSKQCECKPQAELCVGKCGVQNIDGCAVDCGNTSCPMCESGQACSNCTCPGGGVCSNNACCTPEPQATTCGADVCGTKTNNCGQTVNCGGCTGAAQCAQGQCVDPSMRAMVGDYAMRVINFSYSEGQAARSEGYALVNISLRNGQLVMREQACASFVYANIGGSELSEPAATISPQDAKNFPALETTLDLSESRDVPGVKEWFRDKPPLVASALGWRPGRPSYCPAPTAAVPRPAPSSSLPGYNDPGGRGAKKPWLGNADCRCPEEEVAQPGRAACSPLTTPPSQRDACLADWINLSVPYQPGEVSADDEVTDCRVIDEDGDNAPGITVKADARLSASVSLGSATLHSAATAANYMWGDIDESPARRHTGVAMDLPEVRNTIMACVKATGVGTTLCRSSIAELCPPFRMNGSRSNPVDLIPLESQQAPQGGWTCEAFASKEIRTSLFQGSPNLRTSYPPDSSCSLPQ